MNPHPNISSTLSVAHADAQSPGCAWHLDPACLCDVLVPAPVPKDYDIPPAIVALFRESCSSHGGGNDDWFFTAWDATIAHTVIAEIHNPVADVIGMIENHPEVVRMLLDGLPVMQTARKCKVSSHTLTDLRKVLNLSAHGKIAEGRRNMQIRLYVIDQYDNHKKTVAEISRDLKKKNVEHTLMALYQWVQRFAITHPSNQKDT